VDSIRYHPQHNDNCSKQEGDELHILTNVENGCSKLLVREDDEFERALTLSRPAYQATAAIRTNAPTVNICLAPQFERHLPAGRRSPTHGTGWD
jgi:hypothetical protein